MKPNRKKGETNERQIQLFIILPSLFTFFSSFTKKKKKKKMTGAT
jgi:hypothetical protein